MKKYIFVFAAFALCFVLVGCYLLDNDDEEKNPEYPFSVRPHKSSEAIGGIDSIYYDPVAYTFDPGDGLSDSRGFLRFEATNIGDEKLCTVTCTITATSKTGYTRADVSWEPYVGAVAAGDSYWVKEEWNVDEQFYGIVLLNGISDEELDFEYSFSYAQCVDDSDDDKNLGGLVAPPKE